MHRLTLFFSVFRKAVSLREALNGLFALLFIYRYICNIAYLGTLRNVVHMGNTILVTGAYGNLGQAVVRVFRSKGYAIIGMAAPGEKVPEGFDPQGVDMTTVDLLDDASSSAIWGDWNSRKIDVAVFTVGGFAMGGLAETSSADIEKQIRLNFITLYHMVRPLFLKMMKQGHGRIFMIGSRPGGDMRMSKGMVAYGFAKSLVFRLAEMVNLEAEGSDVVASVVIPSVIDTPQNRISMPDADFSAWVKPDDIAEVIHFHCSQEASSLREPIIRMYGRS